MMSYGGALADAAKKQEFAGLMNPYIQQYFGQEFQSAEAGKQRSWQGGENAAERAQREALQRQQQEWQTGESALDRAIRESLQQQQQTWQSGESALGREWQSSESSLERALREKQMGLQYPRTTSYSFRKADTGPGSYAYRANQIMQKYSR
jgi:hypothetical protein